jgi:BirA family biotin operon repressor/biotin-[acetyl-CoA-carboxylase] ligase
LFDILNEHAISSRLQEKGLNYDVIYKKSTNSTNADAKKIVGENNLLIVAEKQTAGKGRYGRSFYSETNGGLYFTLKINNIDINIGDITFFPLIAAVSVSRAVFSLCNIELSVKWPNDLLYKSSSGYKKLCGILTEASIKSENRVVSYVIVGIGLNINNDITDFPDDIKNIASSIKIITGKKFDRTDILCEIVDNFTQLLYLPREQLLDEYKKRLLLDIGISFTQDGRIFKGRAVDINKNGNLIAEFENGEEKIIQSGEINFI